MDGLAQGFKGIFIGGVEQALFVEDDVAAGGFEFFFDEADALAAPAVGAEGEGFVAFGGQALEVAEEGGDGRHHLVVDGRGADGEVFAREDVGQDVGEGVFLDVVEGRGDALLLEGLGDGAGHLLGGVPHGVEDDDGALLEDARRPLLVEVVDLFDVGAPDDAVARRDHLDRQVLERLEGRLCLTAVEREDVGVVLLGLVVEHGEVVLVVEAAAGGEVLAEGVVREEDLLLGAVGDHAVGPVEHRGRHELQRALAEGERVAGLDALVGQVAVAGLESLEALRDARDDLGVRAVRHHEGQGAGVVGLDVVGDDVVDLGRVDDGSDALEELFLERLFDRVDEGDLLVEDQVGVVARAAARLVAVEAAHGPVDGADPVDIFADFNCFHDVTSFFGDYRACLKFSHYASILYRLHHLVNSDCHTRALRPRTGGMQSHFFMKSLFVMCAQMR